VVGGPGVDHQGFVGRQLHRQGRQALDVPQAARRRQRHRDLPVQPQPRLSGRGSSRSNFKSESGFGRARSLRCSEPVASRRALEPFSDARAHRLSPGTGVGIISPPKRSLLMRRALSAVLLTAAFLLPACNLTSQARVESIKQMNEGITQLNKNNISGAERAMQEAIKTDPTHAEAYLNLGKLYRKQGKWIDAEKAFRGAIDNMGEN